MKMKTITALAAAAFLGTSLTAQANLLFSDNFNYPNGCVEANGAWFAYTPASPHLDALVTNQLLILNQDNFDGVAAPSNNFTVSDPVYASFTINVSSLPTTHGGYFCELKDNTNDYVCRIFINGTGTEVPGTYRLGIANFATSITTAGATNYPLDLATGVTYQVVFNYNAGLEYGTLAINPASESDFNNSPAYGNDGTTNVVLQNIHISQIAFSQYTGQGVAAIGNVLVGMAYSDVVTNAPWKPIIGIQPQGTNIYSGNDVTLYTAASGTGPLTYQWLSNGSPLSDGGNVSGSLLNILNLTDLQSTADYRVVISDGAGSVTSQVATVTVNTTPTPPFFTKQPTGATNAIGANITLSASANGTGPITYQWYFEPTNSASFSALSTGPALFLNNVTFANTGLYYVTATGGDGSQNSTTVSVQVTPPPLVTIGYLHSLMSSNPPSGQFPLNGNTIYNIQGVVTSFGELLSQTYSEYFIQDGTGAAVAFINGTGNTNLPPVGALVSIVGPAQQYYGQLEVTPNVTTATNTVDIISYNNALPAPVPLNLALMATNPMGAYGINVQGALVTLTNVYLYSSTAGAAVSGNFPTNSYKALYAFQQPYSAGQTYMTVWVYTYTNSVDQLNTNYFGKPIPGFVYELTGAMGIYNPTQPELYPTRYADFVSTLPAPYRIGMTRTNGLPTLNWPAVTGSTYTLYSANSLPGPWTQTFGLSYYPSAGIYTDTNSTPRKFYRVSSP
jgi:hypothetical protein